MRPKLMAEVQIPIRPRRRIKIDQLPETGVHVFASGYREMREGDLRRYSRNKIATHDIWESPRNRNDRTPQITNFGEEDDGGVSANDFNGVDSEDNRQFVIVFGSGIYTFRADVTSLGDSPLCLKLANRPKSSRLPQWI